MPLFETFSDRHRQKALDGQPQTYTYDELPERVRGQAAHILGDFSIQAGLGSDALFWYRAESIILKSKGSETLLNSVFPFNMIRKYIRFFELR